MTDNNTEIEKHDKDEYRELIKEVLKIKEINLLGEGTYSYVYGIGNEKIIKVCSAKVSFNPKSSKSVEFFESGTFREIFFGNIIKHQNIFTYTETKYDDKLGLYKIGDLMDGDLNDDDFLKDFNTDVFFKLLEDMTSALKHIHSYNLIHSDIKPANILYKKCEDNTYIFKLADFNIIQFCGKNDADNYNVWATPYYSEPNTAKKSAMIDIYMLGATLVHLSVGGTRKTNVQIDLDFLKKKKESIVKNVGFFCYNTIYLMLVDRQDRIYFDHVTKIINAYKKHKKQNGNPEELLIETVFDVPTKSTQDGITYEPIEKISKKTLADRNMKYMMNLGHTRVRKIIKTKTHTELEKFKKLHLVEDDINTEHDIKGDNTDTFCVKLKKMLIIEYAFKNDLAEFLARVASYYPKDPFVSEWIRKKDCTASDINEASVKLCLDEIILDPHLLICPTCAKYINNKNDNTTKSIDDSIGDAEIDETNNASDEDNASDIKQTNKKNKIEKKVEKKIGKKVVKRIVKNIVKKSLVIKTKDLSVNADKGSKKENLTKSKTTKTIKTTKNNTKKAKTTKNEKSRRDT